MNHNRSWISLLGFCVLTAVAAALALGAIFAGASVALASHTAENSAEAQTAVPATSSTHSSNRFTGLITDSRCGARHKRNSGLSATECARACVRMGASYTLVDGDRSYVLIGGDSALKSLAGQRAYVNGSLEGDAILVDSASPF